MHHHQSFLWEQSPVPELRVAHTLTTIRYQYAIGLPAPSPHIDSESSCVCFGPLLYASCVNLHITENPVSYVSMISRIAPADKDGRNKRKLQQQNRTAPGAYST